MGDNQNPYTQPPPFPSDKPNLPMLYYGLIIIGTAAIVLAIYNLIIIRWCTRSRQDNSGQTPPRFTGATAGSRSFEQSNSNLLSSFKFRKENMVGVEHGCDYECAVCLSVFEEGEEVRQLPECKHSFHAACIDMWLHSHSDCPLCRARVDPPPSFFRRFPAVDTTADNSRDHLIGAVANAQFIPIA